jgi:hypothetical protein
MNNPAAAAAILARLAKGAATVHQIHDAMDTVPRAVRYGVIIAELAALVRSADVSIKRDNLGTVTYRLLRKASAAS